MRHLVLVAQAGIIVIDHKSFPGSTDQAILRAQSFAGQLGAYRDGLRVATGRTVAESFIHLPISGMVVPLEVEHGSRD